MIFLPSGLSSIFVFNFFQFCIIEESTLSGMCGDGSESLRWAKIFSFSLIGLLVLVIYMGLDSFQERNLFGY